jgi:hypothetical protein
LTTCAKIGAHFLISIDAWPKTAVDDTRWITRAWTYQEALLSRRRLVFSKEQMYFECYGMYCCESLNLPLETLHRKDMQGFKSVFCSEKRVGIFPKGVGTTAIEIVRRIEEYSKLNLSHPSDILKGMLGIFHAFQTSRLRIYHCGGIPLLPSIPERPGDKPVNGWTRAMGFFTGLFWDLRSRSDRRPGFPSWSWTGWYGPVRWRGQGNLTGQGDASMVWPAIKVDPGVQVKVERVGGQLPALEDLQTSSMHSRISNIIHVTAWTIEVKILRYTEGKCQYTEDRCEMGKHEYEARLELEDGGHLEWQFETFSEVKVSPGDFCKGIILGYDPEDTTPGSFSGPLVLVCTKFGGTMERIGLGKIMCSWCRRYDKDGVQGIREGPPISIMLEALLSGGRLPSPTDPFANQPAELVKSWEEIRLG